jgi:hypothetical protein
LLPAELATTILTGLFGYACAHAVLARTCATHATAIEVTTCRLLVTVQPPQALDVGPSYCSRNDISVIEPTLVHPQRHGQQPRA